MSFIKISNLSFSYCDKKVVDNLNLNIEAGHFVSIIGPSGSGKTTLIKILAKILINYNGQILINKTDLKKYTKYFGYMPQNNLLLPWKNILYNLSLPLIIQGKKLKDIHKIIFSYLDEFQIKDIINCYPTQISGGQKQRVALLRSILINSQFLLLDEPLSQLDDLTRIKLQEFLHFIYRKNNLTILLVTHNIDEAILLSNKIIILNKEGKIYKEFFINLPIVRNRNILVDDKFLSYKKEITKTVMSFN